MKELKLRSSLKSYIRDSYLLVDDNGKLNLNLPVIDCEVGYSPFGSSPQMLQKIRSFDFSEVSKYGELFYDRLLKQTIINRFSDSQLKPENIFFGHGSFNLAERIIHKLIDQSSMLGYGPQFNEIPSEMEAAGGLYKPIPLTRGYEFPIHDIINELKTGAHSILYVDNPNNPTGNIISLEVLEIVIKAAENNGTIVLIDEAYGDFVSDYYSAFNLVHRYSNVMVIRSFSKALGLAAQRVGYMAVSDELKSYYSKLDVPFEPSLVSAIMARMTMEDTQFIGYVRSSSIQCKATIVTALMGIGINILPTHSSVSILTARLEGGNLFSHFQSMGIKVENGVAYKRTNPLMDSSFIRLRVPSFIETRELVQRIKSHDFNVQPIIDGDQL